MTTRILHDVNQSKLYRPKKTHRTVFSFPILLFDSRFANVTLKASRNSITQAFSAPDRYDDVGTFNSAYQKIKLSADWARYLNPLIATFDRANEPVFSHLLSTAGVWQSKTALHPDWHAIITENVLATLVTNALGRANFDRTLAGPLTELGDLSSPSSLGECVYRILPAIGILGSGGDAFQVSEDDKTSAAQFTFEARILGYAYSPQGKTQVAAITAGEKLIPGKA